MIESEVRFVDSQLMSEAIQRLRSAAADNLGNNTRDFRPSTAFELLDKASPITLFYFKASAVTVLPSNASI